DLLARVPNVPSAWMLGGADVVAWSANKKTYYLVQLDPLRAFFARVFGPASDTLRINAPAEHPIAAEELDRIAAIANGLPPGDALAVQRTSSRGAFPPIPRPAVSSIAIASNEILITSQAPADPNDVAAPQPLRVRFPRTAILTGAFTRPPRALEFNRLVKNETSTLLADGGTIAIYDVDTGTLIP